MRNLHHIYICFQLKSWIEFFDPRKHWLIGSWREFILQFHPARKPDAARCLSRREFRVDGF